MLFTDNKRAARPRLGLDLRKAAGPLLCLLGAAAPALCQTVLPLYEGKAPGSEKANWAQKETDNNPYHVKVLYNISQPTLVAYLPAPGAAVGTAVIIAPGGGFHMIGVDYEAADIAKWLNAKGVAAFVLRYRLMHGRTDDPFAEANATFADKRRVDSLIAPVANLAIADGLQAVRYVRSHAEKFHIRPDRIGMMGFSAGGTVTMGTVYRAEAASRPDFAAVLYPYMGFLKNEQVPAAAPPLFICTASDDGLGFALQSSSLYSAWIAANKSAELHMYEKGDHGFGSRKQNLPVDTWTVRFEEWAHAHGWL